MSQSENKFHNASQESFVYCCMFYQLLHTSKIHTSTEKAIVYISHWRVEQRKKCVWPLLFVIENNTDIDKWYIIIIFAILTQPTVTVLIMNINVLSFCLLLSVRKMNAGFSRRGGKVWNVYNKWFPRQMWQHFRAIFCYLVELCEFTRS